MYNAVGEGYLNGILSRRLDVTGSAPAPAVAPELFPNITLENDRPEWGYLKGEARISRYVFVGAALGLYSSMQLYVPGNRNVIAVVTSVVAPSASLYLARAVGISGGIGPWTPAVTNPIDFRWAPQGSGALLETIQNAAEPAMNGVFCLLNANFREFAQPIVITPNTSLVVWSPVANVALDCNITWYERQPLPGELV